jgi:transcriptional regulator NrdR family protein
MSLSVDIVKRSGKRKSEQFAREKLFASIVATCISVNTPDGQSEAVSHAVCDAVTEWLKNKPEVTSHDIRNTATKHLRKYHPEAAYLYEQHKIII